MIPSSRIAIASVVALSAAVLVFVAASATPASRTEPPGSPARPGERLPDLDPVAPDGLTVAVAGSASDPRWHLGFDSAAENVGRGPLIVNGERRNASPTMTAHQITLGRDGSRYVTPKVGRLRFVTSPDHRHWHYLRFMQYELRSAPGYRLVRPDRKTGFCLGDRYDPGRDEPRKPGEPVFEGDCSRDPAAFEVNEGISVGYGDDYSAQLEGQYVDLTGVPAGRYTLVHRVDAGRRLREARRSNNASSVLIDVRWPQGRGAQPSIDLLATCPAAARCRRRPSRQPPF